MQQQTRAQDMPKSLDKGRMKKRGWRQDERCCWCCCCINIVNNNNKSCAADEGGSSKATEAATVGKGGRAKGNGGRGTGKGGSSSFCPWAWLSFFVAHVFHNFVRISAKNLLTHLSRAAFFYTFLLVQRIRRSGTGTRGFHIVYHPPLPLHTIVFCASCHFHVVHAASAIR